ncbi:MAG: PspC domain-containing protein [Coriobacteriia bacterium]|nr:PspC domain-containing protein [Coriobacteriia bacterium]MCL2870730.1 PspC domain-containing protein [Coriobacteriia bacterium]
MTEYDKNTNKQEESHFPRNHPDTVEGRSVGSSFLIIIGGALIVIGALVLAPIVLGPFWAPVQALFTFLGRAFWPVVLILVGFFIIRIALSSRGSEKGPSMGFSPSLPVEGTRLMRSRKNRMIAGVCGGIAEYFNVDPILIRIVVVLLMLLPIGPVFIAYLIAWIIIPLDNR